MVRDDFYYAVNSKVDSSVKVCDDLYNAVDTSSVECYDFYYLVQIRVIKSIRLRWAGHVARMEEGRSTFKF